MSLLEPDIQPSISTVTINMSKELMAHKLKFSCRFCLNERLSQVPLNENTGRRTNLTNAEILRSFTNILVDPNDGLPTMICTKCENLLHLMLIFKNECLESNKTLRNICDALNLEEEEEEDAIRAEGDFEMDEGSSSEESLEVDLETIMCKMEPAIQEVCVNDTIQINGKRIVDDDTTNIQKLDDNQENTNCGKMVQDPVKLARYMRSHDRKKEMKKKRFSCDVCQYRSEHKANVKRHMLVHNNVYEFHCEPCAKNFKRKAELKRHHVKCPNRMNKCKTSLNVGLKAVDNGVRNETSPHLSRKRYVGDQMYACEICSKQYKRKRDRDYHQGLHSRKSQVKEEFTCDICPFRSAYKHCMKRHMLEVHNNLYEFQCEVCNKNFKRKHHLKLHQKWTGKCPSKINKCKTSLKVDLQTVVNGVRNETSPHLSRKRYAGDQMYACEICSKQYKRKNLRDYHQGLHLRKIKGKEMFTCGICPYRSVYKHCIKRHMLVHNNQRDFQCEGCKRKFKRKHDLIIHQRFIGKCPYKGVK